MRCRTAISPFIPPTPPPVSTFDPIAEAFFIAAGNDFATDFYSDETAKNTLNDLIVRYRDLGRLSRIVALHPGIGDTEAQHKLNVMNPLDTDAAYRYVWPNGATHTHEGVKYDGVNQYAQTFINANEAFPAYSFSGKAILKENSMPGAADYMIYGAQGAGRYLLLEYFNNSGVFAQVNVTPPNLQVTSGLTALNGLIGLNCYGFNKLDFWQGGAIQGSQTGDRVGYFPALDPSANDARLYVSALNNNTAPGVNTPQNFGDWTHMYNEFSFGITDAEWIDDNDYLINTFCPALFKTFV